MKKKAEEDRNMRIEKDSMGEIAIPKDALYGPQTQRAIQNFEFSDLKLPKRFIHALGMIKGAAAKANLDLNLLDIKLAKAIMDAAESVAEGQYDKDFPLDIFQTGSGTSTNMNANEVIARLASLRSEQHIHPNDHVNMCQSSNDVIPTAIQVSASIEVFEQLLPALHHLTQVLEKRGKELADIPKTGRTHLMDAVPITFGQEISGWTSQVRHGIDRIEGMRSRLFALPIGGTAVGTGINAHPEFGKRVAILLAQKTGLPFTPHVNYFESIGSQDTSLELSGNLKVLALSFTKIANDLRLMNSGPFSGFGDIKLPPLQPGSSIMPGKVNPVIPEAVLSVCAQVIGNDLSLTLADMSSQFQLNTMLPLIAYNLLQSIRLLSNAAHALANKAIAGFEINSKRIEQQLGLNPILVTALNPVIGYEKGAEIAKRAYQEGRPIIELAKEMTSLSEKELELLLDPRRLTRGGLEDKK